MAARMLAGEYALLHADDIDAGKLQPLGSVHRHQCHAVVCHSTVKIGVERDLIEKAGECRVLRIVGKERGNIGLELLHVLESAAALHIVLFLQRADIIRFFADMIVKLAKLHRLRRLAHFIDQRGKALELGARAL